VARSAVSVARSAVYVPAAALLFLGLISSLAKTSVATPIVVKQSTDPREGKPFPRPVQYYSTFCNLFLNFCSSFRDSLILVSLSLSAPTSVAMKESLIRLQSYDCHACGHL
jgi:hypothetical protein